MRIREQLTQKELDEFLEDKTEIDKLALIRVAIDEREFTFAQQVIDYFKREHGDEWMIELFQQLLSDKLLQTGEKV